MSLYPYEPGFKDRDTSKEAAEAIKPSATYLRRITLEAFVAAGWSGLTADEAAKRLGLSILSIRPRVTELRQRKLLTDTGERRKNESGCSARVLRWIEASKDGQVPLLPEVFSEDAR